MWHKRSQSARRLRDDIFVVVALAFFAWAIPTCFQASQFTTWDLVAFWGAGKVLNAGLDPYQANNWLHFGVPAGFYSPIFLAEMFQPIAALFSDVMKAKLVWTAINVLAGGALSLILVRVSGLRVNVRSVAIAAALLLAFEPFTGTIQLAQTDIIVVLAVAVSWLLLVYRRSFLAGLIFCFAATNPHLILGIGVYYLYRSIVRREYTLLLGMVVGGLAFIASSLVYLNYTIEWITQVLPAKQLDGALNPTQITLVHLATVLGPALGLSSGRSLKAGGLLTALITVLSLVACLMIWHRGKGRSMPIEMGAAVVLTVVATTFAYHQDLMVLTLIGPSVVAVWQDTRSVEKTGYLAICAGTLLFSELTGFINYGVTEFRLPLYAVAPFIAGILLLTQLRADERVMLRIIPWGLATAALSLAGDAWPALAGIEIVESEIALILLGLLGYLLALWRWYGASAPGIEEHQPASYEESRQLATASHTLK